MHYSNFDPMQHTYSVNQQNKTLFGYCYLLQCTIIFCSIQCTTVFHSTNKIFKMFTWWNFCVSAVFDTFVVVVFYVRISFL